MVGIAAMPIVLLLLAFLLVFPALPLRMLAGLLLMLALVGLLFLGVRQAPRAREVRAVVPQLERPAEDAPEFPQLKGPEFIVPG